MDKFQVGDLVRVRSGEFGLVMETDNTDETDLRCKAANVLVGKSKWWIAYDNLEMVSNG